MEANNLYKTLATISDEVEKTTDDAIKSGKISEMVQAFIVNQKKISEGMMMLAGVMQMVIDDEIGVHIESDKTGGN